MSLYVSHINVFGLCKKKRAVTGREQRTPILLYAIADDDDDTFTSIVRMFKHHSHIST